MKLLKYVGEPIILCGQRIAAVGDVGAVCGLCAISNLLLRRICNLHSVVTEGALEKMGDHGPILLETGKYRTNCGMS